MTSPEQSLAAVLGELPAEAFVDRSQVLLATARRRP
jgi:hypothetical protein